MSSTIKRSRPEKIEISYGMKLGFLEVGEMVHLVRQHDCFPDTPSTYLRMGALRECLCTRCGNKKLIPDSLLAQNEMRSCGCLRKSIREKRKQDRINKKQRKQEINILNYEISLKRADLAKAKLMHPTPERAKLINDLGDELRRMHAKKGGLVAQMPVSETPPSNDELALIEGEITGLEQKMAVAELALYKLVRLDGTEEARLILKERIHELKEKIRNLR